MSRPSLLSCPHEILVRIALETACIDVLGPPRHLPPLLATCRRLYSIFVRSPELYGRIFKAKFDITAARRRFGPIALLSKNLATQLKSYCSSLKRIREGNIHADYETLEKDLWNAYFMMAENDGKNAVQLIEYARLPDFVNRLVRARLHEELVQGGWPKENTVRSLALWLLWMVTDMSESRLINVMWLYALSLNLDS